MQKELKYLTIEDVVAMTGVSTRHVMEEIKRKNLQAYKPGKRLLFDPEQVQKWVKKKAV